MPKIIVRPVAESDTAALSGLRRLWTEENAGGPVDDPGFEARFAEWLVRAAADRRMWVAAQADTGELLGMINLAVFERMPRPGHGESRWGYLANAYVLPAYRDCGVGRLLLEELMANARRAGLVRVVLHPSDRAVPFYERAGFGPADMLMAQSL